MHPSEPRHLNNKTSGSPDASTNDSGCRPVPFLVSIDDVSFTYDKPADGLKWTLYQVNFQIQPGEFVCLLGPSGCGKSTLLQLIAGFLKPTRGQVLTGGVQVQGPGPDRAVVSQHPSLYPWLTVLENVSLPLRVRGVPPSERVVKGLEVLKLVGMESSLDLYPHQLSGGMLQRAMVARALVQDPKILLVDEPFAALDALAREQLQHNILRLWERTGTTVLMITHDVEEAVLLATRAIVMGIKPGRLIFERFIDFGRTVAKYGHDPASIKRSERFLATREHLRNLIVPG